jgi:hypothetical protein
MRRTKHPTLPRALENSALSLEGPRLHQKGDYVLQNQGPGGQALSLSQLSDVKFPPLSGVLCDWSNAELLRSRLIEA